MRNNYELHAMVNIDEISIYINKHTSATIQTIESKKVSIRAQG